MVLNTAPSSAFSGSSLIGRSGSVSCVAGSGSLARLRYGYRGRDCRANVCLLPTGEVVYFIASVVVLFNHEERTQRHYLGHTDCVKW